MTKQRSMYRLIAVSIIMIMLIPLLVACGDTNKDESEQQRVLKIATTMDYGSDNDYIRQQFTDLFEFTHKNITIEFISTYDESQRYSGMNGMMIAPGEQPKQPIDILKEKMNGTDKPDVVMVEFEQLASLINENLLTSLDTLMQKDKMDVAEMVPAVIEGLKEQSQDGRLYALAPMFTASAMIYNKKLFTDAGVAFPTDDMTWDSVFQLARQLSKGEGQDRTYGLTFNSYRYSDPFYDMNVYTAPLELQMYDDKGENMTVDTEEWRKAWQTFYDLKKEKIFPDQPNWEEPQPEQPGPFNYHSLLSGKVAMSIINYYDINEVITANRNAVNIENYEPIDWDVVSVPTHPEAPGVGGQVWLNGIMGISATAENPDDAWEFVRFMMSEEWAVQKSKSVQQFVTWKKYNKTRDGLDYNIDAFFKNTPVKNMNNNTIYIEKPDIWQVQNIGQMKFNEVLTDKKTVSEALKEWQTEGNAILKTLMENDGRLNPGDGGFPEPRPMPIDISIEKLQLMEAAGEVMVESEATTEAATTEAVSSEANVSVEAQAAR